jgi:hypothetical protein
MISALLWVLGHTQRIATIGEKRRTRMKKDRGLLFSLFPPDGESIIYLDRLVSPRQPDHSAQSILVSSLGDKKVSMQGCHPIGSPRGVRELSWAFYGGMKEPYEQSNKVDW